MSDRYKQIYEGHDSIAVSKLIYDDGELLIQGFDSGSYLILEVNFPDILVVRLSDEGVRLRLIEELGTINPFVFIDEESELLRWVVEESLNTRDTKLAKHFVIFIGEEIFDVVSFTDPRISTR